MRKLLLLLTCLLMCCCSALALAADKTKAADDSDTIKPMETISATEMNERLQVGNSEDLLYVKIKEDRMEVTGLAALCRHGDIDLLTLVAQLHFFFF